MDPAIERIIRATPSLKGLAQVQANAQAKGLLTDELGAALDVRSGELAREMVRVRTGLDLSDLTPVEEKIVAAVCAYVGVMKREGKDAGRTLLQLKNHGLLGAAEAAVMRATPAQGFTTLENVGRADISFEQIIVDHPADFSVRAQWYARRALGLPNDLPKPPAKAVTPTQEGTIKLVDWLAARRDPHGRIVPFQNREAAAALGWGDLQVYGRAFGNIQSRLDFACYRSGLPPLGLTAEAPFDNAWGREGRNWPFPVARMQAAAQAWRWTDDDLARVAGETQALPGRAMIPWRAEMARDESAMRAWAEGLRPPREAEAEAEAGAEAEAEAEVPAPVVVPPSPLLSAEAPPAYWAFVCNPKRWAIDRFLAEGIEVDTWGVRPADRARFAPGQLGIVRVGVDRRTAAELAGSAPLQAGIYAICEVESGAYDATGASDRFWAEGEAREPGWPTVRLRYVRNLLRTPLTIERMRAEAPEISHFLLDGFQAASFPISATDFQRVVELLGPEAVGDLAEPQGGPTIGMDRLAEIERHYLHASPEVRERVSRTVERGPVGALVKRLNGHRCQICEALGLPSVGFVKPNGVPYVEAHHVMPVSERQVGSLAASNIMTVCATHHRQLHFGVVEVVIAADAFEVALDGVRLRIAKPQLAAP